MSNSVPSTSRDAVVNVMTVHKSGAGEKEGEGAQKG